MGASGEGPVNVAAFVLIDMVIADCPAEPDILGEYGDSRAEESTVASKSVVLGIDGLLRHRESL